jgi:nitroimidazol reductase NimA-like FMN-containing flavoprotein (pyridoxamine 5'-phosphate oxidase superfamily)
MRLNGPWSAEKIGSFLDGAIIPMRLAVVAPDGMPLVASLWFVPEGEHLWCATNRRAHIVKLLALNPKCAFEIAGDTPPYRGVRGQGHASLHDDRGAAILQALLTRYHISPASKLGQFLAANAADETAIRIVPRSLMSWDFTERMTE